MKKTGKDAVERGTGPEIDQGHQNNQISEIPRSALSKQLIFEYSRQGRRKLRKLFF